MAKKKAKTMPADLKGWVDAGHRHRLSPTHIQMARELGLNPKSLGKLDNHHQEQWKAPLPDFIAHLYVKRTGNEAPEVVRTMEDIAAARMAEKEARKQRRQSEAAADPQPAATPTSAEGESGLHDD